MVKLKNTSEKVVLVTGATSGIGLEIAKEFIRRKLITIVTGRNYKLLKKHFKKDKFAYIFKMDLNKTTETKKKIQLILKKFKRIDILINNAAIAVNSPTEKLKEKKIIESFNTNLISPIIICKEVIKVMKKRNYGRIINISSGGSINCAPKYLVYSATKSGLNTIAKSLNNELYNFNIKINTFSPGPCKTKMFPKNPLSPKLCLPYLIKLSMSDKKGASGQFFWFSKKINIIPKLKINWGKPKLNL